MIWKRWTDEEDAFLEENYLEMTRKEIGEALGRTEGAIQGRIRTLGLSEKYQIEYAVYKNDRNVFAGNAKECAEFLGVKLESFYRYVCGKKGRIDIVKLGRWKIEV